MKILALTGMVALLIHCGLSAEEALKPLRGSRVGLPAPEGFSPSARFPGYVSETTGASVVVTEIPAPSAEVTKGFTEEGLKARGMIVLSKEDAAFGDLSGSIW